MPQPDSREMAITGVTLRIHADDERASRAAYTALLGTPAGPDWPVGRDRLTLTGADTGILFQTADRAAAERLLSRRGLDAWIDEDARADVGSETDTGSGTDTGARTGADAAASARRSERYPLLGITGRPAEAVPPGDPVATRIDHLVLSAPGTEPAIALFGGRFGLDLRLVRSLTETVTQLFFRCGGLIVEVVVGGDGPAGARTGIGFLGIAWRVDDADAARERLRASGIEVSDVRSGRKPGTRVLTVREPALGTPTLLIEQSPR